MSDNLATLIDRAVEMCDVLSVNMTIYYENKASIKFVFTKDSFIITKAFSLVEVENIADINILDKKLIATVYELIDQWRANN